MLLLVLADNYLVLFVGWEGVGLASYLLIGFWQHKPTAATAAKKAFVVNRVGDMGMSLAIMLMLATFGSSAFVDVNAGAAAGGQRRPPPCSGLLLLLGACGKSAQVPLQSWLLDAMEGPTPVSALIHAATMVTAGVYLVTRSHAVFSQSEAASTAVVIVGTVTLLFGAWIGCAKDDIKKVLAGSTMSQIGYMMLAAGIGPAGYAVRDLPPADPRLLQGQHVPRRRLGDARHERRREHAALRRAVEGHADHVRTPSPPATWRSSASRSSPATTPRTTSSRPRSSTARSSGVLALLGAGVTAFYMTRLMLMTFFGQKRWRKGVHPHESPLVMTVPLIILGVASVFGGLVLNNWIGRLARSGGRRRTRGRRGAGPAALLADRRAHAAGGGGRGRRSASCSSGPRRTIPTTQPATSVAVHPRRPQRPLRRRVQRGGADASRASSSPPACCGSTTPASTGR